MNAIERAAAGLGLGLLLATGAGGPVAATPTVAQVLAACARGAANGDRGVDAAMCEWYTAPCGCKPGQVDGSVYRWCLPVDEATPTTVRKVIAELRRTPDQRAAIDRVVPGILARLYPCTPGGPE